MSESNIFSGKHHVFLPVIHVDSESQAIDNAVLAKKAGADGVFLINHGEFRDNLVHLANKVAVETEQWVGVNVLGRTPENVLKVCSKYPHVKGIWSDNAGVNELASEFAQFEPSTFVQTRNALKWSGHYFGGVAFKYQRPVAELCKAAKVASSFMDVICTSGPGTGRAADVAKIQELAAGANRPIAIASGITPDNVKSFMPYAQVFLVATGISKNWTNLSLPLMQRLVEKLNS